ncbi:MAG: hypothetical protein HoeaKO_40880 [Hoeflea alexandrii]
MRGANWIPADALPARATPEAVRDLLTSAVEANMNMIRIWVVASTSRTGSTTCAPSWD